MENVLAILPAGEVRVRAVRPARGRSLYSRMRRAIVNTGVKVPESSIIGFDLDADRARGYHVTGAGIVVVS